MVPWEQGKLLIWDIIRTDTFPPWSASITTSDAGAEAALAEVRKVKITTLTSLTPCNL